MQGALGEFSAQDSELLACLDVDVIVARAAEDPEPHSILVKLNNQNSLTAIAGLELCVVANGRDEVLSRIDCSPTHQLHTIQIQIGADIGTINVTVSYESNDKHYSLIRTIDFDD